MENIPKVIHYCWFGGKEKPAMINKCIESWKNKLPDYKIMEWNENNFDVYKHKFSRDAYKLKKWAFVSDYCRLWVLYNYGGIYLDTDMEVLKSLDKFLELESFCGIEFDKNINAAIWGCKKNDKFIERILNYYDHIQFNNHSNNLDSISIPVIITEELKKQGFEISLIPCEVQNIMVFPTEYFYPKGHSWEEANITKNTYTVHHYEASWRSPYEKIRTKLKKVLVDIVGIDIANKIIKLIKR